MEERKGSWCMVWVAPLVSSLSLCAQFVCVVAFWLQCSYAFADQDHVAPAQWMVPFDSRISVLCVLGRTAAATNPQFPHFHVVLLSEFSV